MTILILVQIPFIFIGSFTNIIRIILIFVQKRIILFTIFEKVIIEKHFSRPFQRYIIRPNQ